jgi:uncharacterized membrane protein (DUF2068 family)
VSQTIQEKTSLAVKDQSTTIETTAPHKAPLGLRTVAIFEMSKGLLVLIAGLGLLSLVHRDAEQVAEQIVQLIGLNPAHRYPHIFIDAASRLNDAKLWFLSAAALVYSTVRFVETYGLWHELPWAEWFAVISAGLYLPVELYKLYEKPGIVSLAVPLINIGIVIYLAYLLTTNSKKAKSNANS